MIVRVLPVRYLTVLSGGVFVLFALSCTYAGKKVPNAQPVPSKWHGARITWNSQTVEVSNEVDSLYWYHIGRRSVITDGREKTTGENHRAELAITPAIRDSIIRVSQEVIANAPVTEDWLTDYAGDNVSVEVFTGSTSTALRYKSVPSWLSLSPQHTILKAMTFDRFDSIPKKLVTYKY